MPATDDTVELTIVIPAFREGRKIEKDIHAASSFLAEHLDGCGEIVVVDDGSDDDTAERARAMARDVSELRVVVHAENRGKGYAVRRGVAASRGRRVMFADAGGCVPYEDALVGLELVRDGVAFAHGSRRAPGAVVSEPQRWAAARRKPLVSPAAPLGHGRTAAIARHAVWLQGLRR